MNTASKILKTAGKTFTYADGVFAIEESTNLRLFDFNRGRFYSLDSCGANLLGWILEFGFDEAIQRGSSHYGVSSELVHNDAIELLDELLARRIVKRQSQAFVPCKTDVPKNKSLATSNLLNTVFQRPRQSAKVPSQFTMILSLILAWWSLRLLGWRRSLTLFEKTFVYSNLSPISELAREFEQRFSRAAASFCFLQINCKERALAGYGLLRHFLGIDGEIVVGIHRYPFEAHAWVESCDTFYTDEREHCETFEVIARFK